LVLAYRHIGWVGAVAAIVAIASAGAMIRRVGHIEGYMDGYDAGFEGGIFKAYGIAAKDIPDICERATDMKFDEHVLSAFDRKRKQS
jgi:hypothetical protein